MWRCWLKAFWRNFRPRCNERFWGSNNERVEIFIYDRQFFVRIWINEVLIIAKSHIGVERGLRVKKIIILTYQITPDTKLESKFFLGKRCLFNALDLLYRLSVRIALKLPQIPVFCLFNLLGSGFLSQLIQSDHKSSAILMEGFVVNFTLNPPHTIVFANRV